MSKWTYFTGIISINDNINLSQILQHAPVGSEGGLLLHTTTVPNAYLNTYMLNCGLRDITNDANLKYKIDFWLQRIKPFIIDLFLRITFTAEDTTIFYSIDKDYKIFNHTIGKL